MHIMEGFLPIRHAIGWSLLSLPLMICGLTSIKKRVQQKPELKMILGVSAAFVFVLSALKIPSISGSCSHITGVGLGAILLGPLAMIPIGTIVLLFQALLLAHGGLTTLGANSFSMAIVGPFVAYLFYGGGKLIKLPLWLSIFLAAFFSDLFTYLVTSIQLAWAFPDAAVASGFISSLFKFVTVFAFTQIPLAISEGLLTVITFNMLVRYNAFELSSLGAIAEKEI